MQPTTVSSSIQIMKQFWSLATVWVKPTPGSLLIIAGMKIQIRLQNGQKYIWKCDLNRPERAFSLEHLSSLSIFGIIMNTLLLNVDLSEHSIKKTSQENNWKHFLLSVYVAFQGHRNIKIIKEQLLQIGISWFPWTLTTKLYPIYRLFSS